MIATGPEICHVDRCAHGCTASTGCGGHEFRLNHAERYLRYKADDLVIEAARWGFVVRLDMSKAEPLHAPCAK